MIARFLEETDTFPFACQMTGDCCRHFSIYCTPYDIIRLRHATGLSTRAMLERGFYEIVEESFNAVFGNSGVGALLNLFGAPPRDLFPVARLRKAEDDRGPRCTFLAPDGRCGVYAHRPGVCRSYPLGRVRTPEGPRWFEREYGCPGKGCGTQQVRDWIAESGLHAYAHGNDRFATFAEDVMAAGVAYRDLPGRAQAALRTLLYDFDRLWPEARLTDFALLARLDEAAHDWLREAARAGTRRASAPTARPESSPVLR